MADDKPSPHPAGPSRARRWRASPPTPARSPYSFALRLIGIPVIAILGVLLYRGIRDRLELPACDSGTAKRTLSEVLKELKLEPTQYAPISTISTSKDQVVCHAEMPLPNGAGVVVADYTFYWQGSKATMRYSVHRQAQPTPPPPAPPQAPRP